MPPLAAFDVVVDDESLPLSDRTNPSNCKIHSRFLLVEDPMKAPMNPEEIQFMRRSKQIEKQSKNQPMISSMILPVRAAPAQPADHQIMMKQKKIVKNFFQRFGKPNFRGRPVPRKQ